MTAIRDRLRHLKNPAWALVENLTYPALMLLATPVLLRALGPEEFGLNALAVAILALVGPTSLGLGTATVKFVSAHRGENRMGEALNVVRTTLALSILTALVVLAAALAFADVAAARLFPAMGDHDRVALALRLAATIVAIGQIDIVFTSALRGAERFDVTARLELCFRLCGIALSVVLAIVWKSAVVMLWGALALSVIGCGAKAYIASRVLQGPVWRPVFRKGFGGSLLRFAGWSWVQSNAGALFQILDRLIVGSALGAAVLASYTVCTQLGQQVHAVPAAALATLFPLISRKLGAGQIAGVRRIENVSVVVSMVVVVPLCLVLALGREPILALWMGEEFAQENSMLFLWVVVAYGTLALGLAPYFLLMGRGDIRFLSLLSLASGAVSLIAMLLMVEPYGALGVAWARICYGGLFLLAYWRLLHLRRQPGG